MLTKLFYNCILKVTYWRVVKGTVREFSQTDIRYSSRVTIYIKRHAAERREKGGVPFLYVKYDVACFFTI